MSNFPPLHDARLHAAGLTGRCLVDDRGQLWLPYDIPRCRTAIGGLHALETLRPVFCARDGAIAPNWAAFQTLYLINGMGVSLGDNIVGLSLAWALKCAQPHLRLVMLQAAYLPPAVAELHALCASWLETRRLPQPLASIPSSALVIDLADFAYWPGFESQSLHTFFAHALGLKPSALDSATLRNRWLRNLSLPALPPPWSESPYVLLAPHASSALRDIPPDVQLELAEQVWKHYRLPIASFAPLAHSAVHHIGSPAPETAHFLAWVRGAALLVATDTAAVHAAAGFDVPTLAGFVCVAPALRVATYSNCHALDLRTPQLDGQQFNESPAQIALAHDSWRAILRAALPWPKLKLAERDS